MKTKENQVLIGKENNIAGIVMLPMKEAPNPAVLLLHGFASHKDEVGNMFADLAIELAKQGVGSLRIDFRGWGESGGDMADTTVSRLLEAAQVASRYLLSHQEVDPTRLGIIGFSLGAAVALLAAAENPARFKTMALWSPARRLREQFLESLGEDNFATAKKHGQVTIDLGWHSVTLKNDFFDSLEAFNPGHAIKKFPGALLAIAGSSDSPAAENARNYVAAAATSQKRLVIIDGANHTFNVLSGDCTVATGVIAETSRWMLETLA
ncbi:alpha/beta hydrolase family protein [Candidatus Leptofilum sp.]|uniref:alpha/beta hydrolase family protein n=1 Tax=Candidatus Leptofilum sp. TaxID=3241576 RepID=UPI003B5903C6